MTNSERQACVWPRAGVFRDTPLDTRYNSFDSERYILTMNDRAWRDIAAPAPYDFVTILVNSRQYGGGGIYNLYTTTAVDSAFSAYIYVHELGHHLAGLGDEYYTSDVAYEEFSGRLQEWGGTVLTVVGREDGSGTRAFFERIALSGQSTTLNAVVMPSGEAMVDHVASTPGAIGYISTLHLGATQSDQSGEAWRLDEGVRVLPVEGLAPTEQTIGDGTYLLWRQLYLASRGEPKGEAREFAQWLLRNDRIGESERLMYARR